MRQPSLPEAVAIIDLMNQFKLTAFGDSRTRHSIGKESREVSILSIMDGQVDLNEITDEQALELYWIATKDFPLLPTVMKCVEKFNENDLGKEGIVFRKMHVTHPIRKALKTGEKERIKLEKKLKGDW